MPRWFLIVSRPGGDVPHIELMRTTAGRHFRRLPTIRLDASCSGQIQMGPHVLTQREIAELAFGMQGGAVSVGRFEMDLRDFGGNGMADVYQVISAHQAFATPATRFIYYSVDPGRAGPVLFNFKVTVHEQFQNKGIGTIASALQVRRARQLGFIALDALAMGYLSHPTYRGYGYWPKRGFGGTIPADIWGRLPADGLLNLGLRHEDGQVDVRDLVGLPGGEDFWWLHGEGFQMSFDLSDANPYVQSQQNLLKELGL